MDVAGTKYSKPTTKQGPANRKPGYTRAFQGSRVIYLKTQHQANQQNHTRPASDHSSLPTPSRLAVENAIAHRDTVLRHLPCPPVRR